MSKIDDQIKALQLKKLKVDYLSYISDLLKGDKHCVDFKDVKEEILGLLDPIILKLMTAIENDQSTDVDGLDLADNERVALKMLAGEAAKRMNGNVAQPKTQPASPYSDGNVKPQQPSKPKPPVTQHVDKMQFAIANRHLGGKKVQVLNDKNMHVTGEVVGLDAPMVVVKTDAGPTIEVPLERIVPL